MSADGSVLEFEPFKPGPTEQLPAVYAELRERFPVYRSASNIWVISRFDDVKAVQSNPDMPYVHQGSMIAASANPFYRSSSHDQLENLVTSSVFEIPGQVRRFLRVISIDRLDQIVSKNTSFFPPVRQEQRC